MSTMTEEQKNRCRLIIHSAAAAAGAGNVAPIPGLGVAADVVAMTMMATSLAAVFGASISEEVAKGMAVSALKHTMLRQPIKVLAKELSKLIPFAGQLVAPAVSAGMIEAAGWALANDMAARVQRNSAAYG